MGLRFINADGSELTHEEAACLQQLGAVGHAVNGDSNLLKLSYYKKGSALDNLFGAMEKDRSIYLNADGSELDMEEADAMKELGMEAEHITTRHGSAGEIYVHQFKGIPPETTMFDFFRMAEEEQ